MTSSSPAVACLDYAPHKGVGEVAVRARRSCKSLWLGMVLKLNDIYLTAVGLTPGGSITRHIYNKQYTQYIECTILEVRAVPRLCQLYPDICLTTEGKARKKLQLG